MKHSKKFICAILSLTLVLTLISPAYADTIRDAFNSNADKTLDSYASVYGWNKANMGKDKWTGTDGKEYKVQNKYQKEYLEDLITTTSAFMGISRMTDSAGTAGSIVDIALAEVGTAEEPFGYSTVKYNTWFYGHEVREAEYDGDTYAWCAVFVVWCADQAGLLRDSNSKNGIFLRTANCGTLYDDLTQHNGFSSYYVRNCSQFGGNAYDIQVGDIFFYAGADGTGKSHVGIVSEVGSDYINVVQGNTGRAVKVRTHKNGDGSTSDNRFRGAIVVHVKYPNAIFTAFNFFTKQMGLSDAAACAILGNMSWESGGGVDINPDSKGGIACWLGGRWTKLENFCKERNIPVRSLSSQLLFTQYELEHSFPEILAFLKSQPNTLQGCYNMTDYLGLHYEVYTTEPSQLESRRRVAAQNFWNKYH